MDETEIECAVGKSIRGRWCYWAVKRKPESGEEVRVRVYKCRRKGETILRQEVEYPVEGREGNDWFHGTDIYSAINIVTNGIKLSRGQPCQDFSLENGFYVAPNLGSARHWASVKSKQPAVVVFKLTPMQLGKFKSMDLKYAESLWEAVVRHNRSGGRTALAHDRDLLLTDRYNNCDYICGAINQGKTGPKCLDGNWEKWCPSGFWNRQLCIKTDRLATWFGEPSNIDCVLLD